MLETGAGAVLEFDRDEFGRAFGRRSIALRHDLAGHPLMTLDAIAELADRFPGRIERHSADLELLAPGGAPELEGPPSETVRGIDTNRSWMVFWYIDQVPEYRRLLDECLDHTQPHLPAGEVPAVQREAFLFLSAPDAVTPLHFDPEHNFLLQIRGHKTMNVCPFGTAEAERRELDRYHDGGHRNLEVLLSDGEAFALGPGEGVYVPTFMPHWVQNGPEASISLSITFRTPSSRRAERINWMNARLRRLGVSAKPPGRSARRDRAKESIWIAAHELARGSRSALRAVRRPSHARSQRS